LNILLDTHIWLWACLEDEQIGKRLAAALEDSRNSFGFPR